MEDSTPKSAKKQPNSPGVKRMTWTDTVSAAISALTENTKNEYHSIKDIESHIDENWETLCGDRKKSMSWRQILFETLTRSKKKSSPSPFKSQGGSKVLWKAVAVDTSQEIAAPSLDPSSSTEAADHLGQEQNSNEEKEEAVKEEGEKKEEAAEEVKKKDLEDGYYSTPSEASSADVRPPPLLSPACSPREISSKKGRGSASKRQFARKSSQNTPKSASTKKRKSVQGSAEEKEGSTKKRKSLQGSAKKESAMKRKSLTEGSAKKRKSLQGTSKEGSTKKAGRPPKTKKSGGEGEGEHEKEDENMKDAGVDENGEDTRGEQVTLAVLAPSTSESGGSSSAKQSGTLFPLEENGLKYVKCEFIKDASPDADLDIVSISRDQNVDKLKEQLVALKGCPTKVLDHIRVQFKARGQVELQPVTHAGWEAFYDTVDRLHVSEDPSGTADCMY